MRDRRGDIGWTINWWMLLKESAYILPPSHLISIFLHRRAGDIPCSGGKKQTRMQPRGLHHYSQARVPSPGTYPLRYENRGGTNPPPPLQVWIKRTQKEKGRQHPPQNGSLLLNEKAVRSSVAEPCHFAQVPGPNFFSTFRFRLRFRFLFCATGTGTGTGTGTQSKDTVPVLLGSK